MKLSLKHIYIPDINFEFEVEADDLKDRASFLKCIGRSGLDVQAIVEDSMEYARQGALKHFEEANSAAETPAG